MPPTTRETLLAWATRLGVELTGRVIPAEPPQLTVRRGETAFTLPVPMGCRGEKAYMLWVLLLRCESYFHTYDAAFAQFAADTAYEHMGLDSKQRVWQTIRQTAEGMRAVLGDDLDAGLDMARELRRTRSRQDEQTVASSPP